MNKKLKTSLCITLIVLLIIVGTLNLILFFIEKHRFEWFRENGGGYSVVGKGIGEPSWGGTSKVLIELYETDKNTLLNQFETMIDTDGNSLTEQNYKVSIGNDHITLVLYNNDKTLSGAYRFYYEDLANTDN